MSTDTPALAAEAKTTRLFPLNLTPFEDYMVWDDRPEFPMTFVVRFIFEGEIDREAMTSALPKALARHPLLQANIARAKGNRDCWVAASNPHIDIDWGNLDDPIRLPKGEAIDLRSEIGLRIWIRTDGERAIMTTQFHHACCDGIGAYQFLGDWLWYYAEAVGQPVPTPLPDIDPKDLRRRTKAAYNIDDYRREDGSINYNLREVRHFCLRPMAPTAPPRNASRTDGDGLEGRFPGLCDIEFDKDTYKSIRHLAGARGQSANELLIERLFVTLRQWNESQGRSSGAKLCIMMPMDLREIEFRLPMAANLVSYGMLRRKPSECVESESLIDSIRQEMVQMKHNRHRTPFMGVIAHMRQYPVWLRKFLVGRRCMATAILSNTGDPKKRFTVPLPTEKGLVRAGNLILTDLDGVPPMRRGTRTTISIFTYRRALKICMRCDPHLFSTDQTQALLNHYRDSILRLLQD